MSHQKVFDAVVGNEKPQLTTSSNNEMAKEAIVTNNCGIRGGSDKGEEPNNPASSTISSIRLRKNDVLFGRGKPYHTYPGNLRMLKIIAKNKARYADVAKEAKRPFAEYVLDMILEGGTRFLRKVEDSKGWEEVSRPAAAAKVWHALRYKKRPSAAVFRVSAKEVRDTIMEDNGSPKPPNSSKHGVSGALWNDSSARNILPRLLALENSTASLQRCHLYDIVPQPNQSLGSALFPPYNNLSTLRTLPSMVYSQRLYDESAIHQLRVLLDLIQGKSRF